MESCKNISETFAIILCLLHLFPRRMPLKSNVTQFNKKPLSISTPERQLSGLGLCGLSNYPDKSDVLLCIFSGIFQNFSFKNLSFPADSLKEVEKIFLFLFKNTVLKN